MHEDELEYLAVSALLARENVTKLEAERVMAVMTGVAEIPSYMRDLDEELELWRRLYVSSAVTEIATLQAQLDGPRVG
jgi:hypothetical protein